MKYITGLCEKCNEQFTLKSLAGNFQEGKEFGFCCSHCSHFNELDSLETAFRLGVERGVKKVGEIIIKIIEGKL